MPAETDQDAEADFSWAANRTGITGKPDPRRTIFLEELSDVRDAIVAAETYLEAAQVMAEGGNQTAFGVNVGRAMQCVMRASCGLRGRP